MIASRSLIAAVLLACVALPARHAAAQGHSVVACRDRSGAIVTCASGGGGGGGGGGGYTDPTGGAMGGMAYSLGYGLGAMFRNMIMGDPDEDAAEAAEQARRDAEAARVNAERVARQRATLQQNQEQSRRAAADQQQKFRSDQSQLLQQIRPLNASASPSFGFNEIKPRQIEAEPTAARTTADQPSAFQQLQSANKDVQGIGAKSLEAQHEAASKAFDRQQTSPGAGLPKLEIKGVQQAAPDPMLRPMTLQQRALIADGRRAQQQLDELRAKRTRGEVEESVADREEATLVRTINDLANRFAALGSVISDAPAAPAGPGVAASIPAPVPPPPPQPPANGVVAGLVGSCQPADPAAAGCIEIHNVGAQRVRVYFQEFAGVFCTIEPGSMCSRPMPVAVYHGYAQGDDGMRTSLATLDLKREGLRWRVER